MIVDIKDMPKYMLLMHGVCMYLTVLHIQLHSLAYRHSCTVLHTYIVYFRNISLSYLCLRHGRNVSAALCKCSIQGVWNAASRSNSHMRPRWACVSINHTITGGHHLNVGHSCRPNPFYYVLLACEIPLCRKNHGIQHWRELYCISKRLTMATVKNHSQPLLKKKNILKYAKFPLKIPCLPPSCISMLHQAVWHIWHVQYQQD